MRKAIKAFVTMALFIVGEALISFASAPNVSVNSEVDKGEITVGELFHYTVTVKYPDGTNVHIPYITDKLGEFIVRNISTPKPHKENGMIVEQVTYELTTYFTGDMKAPPVEITYSYKNERGEEVSETIKTAPLEIKVKNVSPEGALDIKDIKAPVDIPVGWRYWALVGGVPAGVIILIALGYYLWKKRKKKEALVLQAPPRPAHETALEKLKQIEELDLIAKGQFKEYYDLVTDTLREYLGARYTIDAMELTTYELSKTLADSVRNLELKDKIISILEEGDLVKFAKFEPDKQRALLATKTAREIIEATMPWVYKKEVTVGTESKGAGKSEVS